MNQIDLQILDFLKEKLAIQGLSVKESGPMTLISQVNWAIKQMNLSIDSEQAFDIAGKIYRHFQQK